MSKTLFKMALITMCMSAFVAACNGDEESGAVPVAGVAISQDTLRLAPNGTAKLTATVTPNNATDKTVTWSSADDAVAEVAEDGTVTAKAVGNTTITATASGKTATSVVIVAEGTPVVEVTGVSLNKLSLALVIGGKEKLTATVEPDNATNKTVSWSSSAETIATVANDGTVTAAAEGSATITATASGKTATAVVTVTKEAPPTEEGWTEVTASPFTASGKFVDDEVTLPEESALYKQGRTGVLQYRLIVSTPSIVTLHDNNYDAYNVGFYVYTDKSNVGNMLSTENHGIVNTGAWPPISLTLDVGTYYIIAFFCRDRADVTNYVYDVEITSTALATTTTATEIAHGGAKWADRNVIWPGFFEADATKATSIYTEAYFNAGTNICPTGWRLPSFAEFEAAVAGGIAINKSGDDWVSVTIKDAQNHELVLPAPGGAVYHHQPDATSKGAAFFGWWGEELHWLEAAGGTYTNQWAWTQLVRCVKE
ncbi:MAG: Ig-like domain-containing protein [Prevotellaceae bacterium]|jgi:hypothetical protein|nr:Ig-like domain-containing protein [Prevotellaceae bacterium]